jgi:hypothetical protein
MDYENVYYVENRNATPVVVDHRTGQRVPVRSQIVTSAAPPASAPGAIAPAWSQSAAPYQYPMPNYYGPTMMPNGWAGYPVNPPYVMPPVGPASNLATILGGFGDIGTLANIVAQAFAAFLPLPASPTPQDGSDSDQATNAAVNSSNLIRYQNALALFARRDQQILTLGSILKELFKRPGTVIG